MNKILHLDSAVSFAHPLDKLIVDLLMEVETSKRCTSLTSGADRREHRSAYGKLDIGVVVYYESVVTST